MNYVKKMCILRQVKQGFSADGKPLSGLVKVEQYGKNLAVEVSIINFAPLSLGDYYCIVADNFKHTEMLSLRGKSLFNVLTDLDVSAGFCAVICYVKNDVIPIAYGVNGDEQYDFREIVRLISPQKSHNVERPQTAFTTTESQTERDQNQRSPTEKRVEDGAQTDEPSPYDDEKMSMENYYEKEQPDEPKLFYQTDDDAQTKSATEKQDAKDGANFSKDGNVDGVLHPFKTDEDGDAYYQSVKHELGELLQKYPRDNTLSSAFSCSEWVRLKGTPEKPEYLVGVVYVGDIAKYVCYALYAEDKDHPPTEIADVCVFVPSSLFNEEHGFFVIFQSAATGECIKPQKA